MRPLLARHLLYIAVLLQGAHNQPPALDDLIC